VLNEGSFRLKPVLHNEARVRKGYQLFEEPVLIIQLLQEAKILSFPQAKSNISG